MPALKLFGGPRRRRANPRTRKGLGRRASNSEIAKLCWGRSIRCDSQGSRLLARTDERWSVWIDCYEAQLVGPADLLEREEVALCPMTCGRKEPRL